VNEGEVEQQRHSTALGRVDEIDSASAGVVSIAESVHTQHSAHLSTWSATFRPCDEFRQHETPTVPIDSTHVVCLRLIL